ncbi:MAG: VWA domain-containing protein [Acidobacteria bacterium]|nr:VWA domain-containing protein [Acidobacteriota bacterium]MCA1637643.1 VWA domain-containing protein [Acidobacteriota bacterium]
MKRNNFLILTAFCIALASAFYNFSLAKAQTTQPANRSQRPSPTVTPLVSSNPKSSPTVTPAPEEEDDIIKIDTELVNLNVRVVDRNNRPVNNLTQNDFKVYEDNALQPIEFFSKSEVPTNYSLVIDNSGSLRLQLDKVIEASKMLVATNRPDDETSVVRFVSSDKIEIVQDFTKSKPDLNDALDNLFIEGGQTAIIDAVYLAADKVDTYEKTRNPNDRKRRALVLVSDGEDRDSFYKEQQLYELLRETDVQIYVIGFIGELSKEGGFISKSPQGKAKAFLERLAAETGGKVYFPNSLNELPAIAQDISSELRTQYSIGYSPTNPAQIGAYKNIKVVVAEGPKKEKRIAITRSGITRTGNITLKPSLQNPNQKPKTQ